MVLLTKRGIADTAFMALMMVVLEMAILFLEIDQFPGSRKLSKAAGSQTSFTVCIDHMLPGEQPRIMHLRPSSYAR